MKKYIGIDVHSSTCTFCVVNESGEELDNTTIQTNGRLIINHLRGISGYKILTFEECELGSWLSEVIHKEVEEMIVCNPVYNREYKTAKNDKLDARKLAKLLRGGFLTPVFHDGSDREKFRSLMSAYEDLVIEAVRLKNRYKSLFRKTGNMVRGGTLYNDESLLDGLNRSDFKFIGKQIYHLLEEMEQVRQKYIEQIKQAGRKFKEIRILDTLPGIGPIQAAKISAQVIDPGRFASKYKYFSYCGLVRHRRISGTREYGSKKIWGNRTLKCVYKMAAHAALRGNNGLKKYYKHLRTKGVSDKSARNAVSRKIAAISLSLWKNNCVYDDKIVTRDLIK